MQRYNIVNVYLKKVIKCERFLRHMRGVKYKTLFEMKLNSQPGPHFDY